VQAFRWIRMAGASANSAEEEENAPDTPGATPGKLHVDRAIFLGGGLFPAVHR